MDIEKDQLGRIAHQVLGCASSANSLLRSAGQRRIDQTAETLLSSPGGDR